VTAPPQLAEPCDEVVPVRVCSAEQDIWVQVKCTHTPWTCTELLGENLLFNFVCNSYISESQGRKGDVRLVTPAEIRAKEIDQFSRSPDEKPDLASKLDGIVQRVHAKLAQAPPQAEVSRDSIRERALSVLASIARCEPVSLRCLTAEIEASLAYRLTSARIVQDVCQKLLAAMLSDSAQGPDKARPYDAAWIGEVIGFDLFSEMPLDVGPGKACDEQVRTSRPENFAAERYAPRGSLLAALREFLLTDHTLFVLIGRTGTGRSWAMSDWLSRELAGRVRLFVPGYRLECSANLDSILANEMAALTAVELSTPELAKRILAPARSPSLGPMVIVFDDIQPPPERASEFRQMLQRIVSQARQHRAKIVITCQSDRWELHQPGTEVPIDTVFVPDRAPPIEAESYENEPEKARIPPAGERHSSRMDDSGTVEPDPAGKMAVIVRERQPRDSQRVSFVLSDLTDEEFAVAVGQRLPAAKSQRILQRLRLPAFHVLRNAYLLERYLEPHVSLTGADATGSDRVIIHELLEQRVQAWLHRIAADLTLDIDSVRTTVDGFIDFLWCHRSRRVSLFETSDWLGGALSGQGKTAFDAFRRHGLISIADGIRISEAAIAATLSAKRLMALAEEPDRLCRELLPELDFETVTALLPMHRDAATLAEMLVTRDKRWLKPVAHGLARCSPNDPRIIASLVALARQERDGSGDPEACDMLGVLAATGRRCKKALTQMFLSPDWANRGLAERALWNMSRYAPESVAKAVRTKVRRELRLFAAGDKKDRTRLRLAHALRPLRNPDSKLAGSGVRRILAELENLACASVTEPGLDARQRLANALTDTLLEDYDELRWLLTFQTGEPSVASLVAELVAVDAVTRARAAQAIRPLADRAPLELREAVLRAIRQESEPEILARLLWNGYRLLETCRTEALLSIGASRVTNWDSLELTGTAFCVLEGLAPGQLEAVTSLVPRQLDKVDASARALLGEPMACCWWRLTRAPVQQRSEVLERFTKPTFDGVPDMFRPFVCRNAAVACMLLMAAETGVEKAPTIRRMDFRGNGPPYFKGDMAAWVKPQADRFVSHEQFESLRDALIQVALEAHRHHPDVLDKWLRNVQFFCVRDSLGVLAELAKRSDDPVAILSQLPRDWEAIFTATQLLNGGRSDRALVEFAKQACAEHETQGMPQAIHERTECLIALSRIDPSSSQFVSRERSSLTWFFGGEEADAKRFGAQVDQDPAMLLERLEAALPNPEDCALLYEWENAAQRWQSLLVAHVFGRMFQPQPIGLAEALALLEGMLMAIDALPPEPIRDEHIGVYSAIQAALQGRRIPRVAVRNASGPIPQSHVLAAEILERAGDTSTRCKLHPFLLDSRGYWESDGHKLNADGSLSHGSGTKHYLVVFQPAVRLAALAVGRTIGWADPAATLMSEQYEVQRLLDEHHYPLHYIEASGETVRSAIEAFNKVVDRMPYNERARDALGNLLVRAGRSSDAKRELALCLELPACVGRLRGGTLYNLACAHAQLGEIEACRHALGEADRLGGLDREWMHNDPDFAKVRDADWFVALCEPVRNTE
jgi:hypothetical protein